ncbi:MAG: Anti-sigma factor antagonist [Actinotalea sp.]|jgi:anti-sigma B factor antagonist|nr:Anti-sigma factor antagonist [Actinotalea sp.]
MASPPTGTITVTAAPAATIVLLSGAIDLDTKAMAADALQAVASRKVAVVLDATAVTFLDSTGIAFMVDCAKRATALGVGLTLVRPPRHVMYVLEILGIAPLFQVVHEEPGDDRAASAG